MHSWPGNCCSKNSTLSHVVKNQEEIISNRLIAFTASLKASRKSGKRSRSAPIESSPISGFSTAEIATMIAAGSRSVTDLIPKALTMARNLRHCSQPAFPSHAHHGIRRNTWLTQTRHLHDHHSYHSTLNIRGALFNDPLLLPDQEEAQQF